MPRKPTKHDDPEQSKRFMEAAEEAEADDEGVLERALKNIGSKPLASPSRPRGKQASS